MSTPPPITPSYQPLRSQAQAGTGSRNAPADPSPSESHPTSTFPPGSSLSSLPAHLSPSAPYTPASPPSREDRSSPVASSPHAGPNPSSPVRQPGTNGAVDVETVLKAAGGDTRLALEMIVTERNSFHSQNSQLWKMIEKQKRNAAHLVADNERLRSERDRAGGGSSSGVGLGIASSSQRGKPSEAPPIRRQLSDQPNSPIIEEPEGSLTRRRSTKPTMQRLATDESTRSSASATFPDSSRKGLGLPTSLVSGSGSSKTPTAGAGTPQLLPSPPLDPPTFSRQARSERQSFPPEVQRYMALAESANLDGADCTSERSEESRERSSQASSPIVAQPSQQGMPEEHLRRPRIPTINALIGTPPQQGTDLPPLVPLSPFFADSPNSSTGARRTAPSSATDSPGSNRRAPTSDRAELQRQQAAASGPSQSQISQGTSSPHQPSLRSQRSTEGSNDGELDLRQAIGDVPPPFSASQAPTRQPKLMPALLSYARVSIPNSSIFPNHLGKDVLCFIVSITVRPPNSSQVITWSVGKLFSAFVELDARIKNHLPGGRREARSLGIQQLPEGRAWKDFAPSKIDQRKATLEAYLQSLLKAPLADKTDLCDFLSSDAVSASMASGAPLAGRKEGYLTKKGKNFGGWKTRFFVLNGPTMEYYESRGGTHLGSIPIVNAQIGRQHKDKPLELADDNSYRHAFLIIEARRAGFTTATRHVLCAESDEDRDSWVEMLVRYVTGEYTPPSPELSKSVPEPLSQDSIPRSSTSSSVAGDFSRRAPAVRKHSGEVVITRGAAQPLSSLSADASNAKLFQPIPSPSVINAMEASGHPCESSAASSVLPTEKRGESPHPSFSSVKSIETPVSSSPPTNLDSALPTSDAQDRPATSLGAPLGFTSRKAKRQSILPPAQPERMAERMTRQSFAPSYLSRMTSPSSSDTKDASRLLSQNISAPSGGQPIPTGYKFGAKDVPNETSDRDKKAKSGRFWGFGKSDRTAGPMPVSRPVFGTPLTDSVAVANVADLPAIVFRCIQYLEAKHAEQEEGIYRLSGSSAIIKGLRDRFNSEGDIDLLANDEHWDPHAIAGLLKSYLRELPTSLLTRELHLHFIATMDFIDPRERVTELSRLVSALPSPNYNILRALTSHLILIVKNSTVNKMTLRNIGIVFSPTLGIPAGIFSELVSHFTAVFDDEPEHLTLLEDGVGLDRAVVPQARERDVDAIGRRNRNSMLYQAAGADVMLGLGGRELDAQTDDSGSDLGEFDPPVDSDAESAYDPDVTVRQTELPQVEVIHGRA